MKFVFKSCQVFRSSLCLFLSTLAEVCFSTTCHHQALLEVTRRQLKMGKGDFCDQISSLASKRPGCFCPGRYTSSGAGGGAGSVRVRRVRGNGDVKECSPSPLLPHPIHPYLSLPRRRGVAVCPARTTAANLSNFTMISYPAESATGEAHSLPNERDGRGERAP